MVESSRAGVVVHLLSSGRVIVLLKRSILVVYK